METHEQQQTTAGIKIVIGDILSTEETDIATCDTLPLPVLGEQHRNQSFHLNWWCVLALFLLVMLLGEHVAPLVASVARSYVHPTATITIFSQQKQMRRTYTFLAVTGNADPTENQISSRILSFTTPPITTTIHTTGIAHTPAIQAQGTLTLYNEAPYSQTIAAGTVLTGSTGMHIVTDTSVTIAAGNPPSLGSASVAAHAVAAGVKGNIAPLDINGLCCFSGIYAKNQTSFSGGADPKAYAILSQADLTREAQASAGILHVAAEQGIHNQLQPQEQFVQPMHCKQIISSMPQVGDQATEAKISVAEQCTAQVYDYSVLQSLVRAHVLADAGSTLQPRSLSIALTKAHLLENTHHIYQLMVRVSGTLLFHLTTSQVHTLKMQIAGKTLNDARTHLLQLAGVQGVYIKPVSQTDMTLPTNPSDIQIIVS